MKSIPFSRTNVLLIMIMVVFAFCMLSPQFREGAYKFVQSIGQVNTTVMEGRIKQDLGDVLTNGYAGETVTYEGKTFYCQQSGGYVNASFDFNSSSVSKFINACPTDNPTLLSVLKELLEEAKRRVQADRNTLGKYYKPYSDFRSDWAVDALTKWIAMLGG